ncbi:MAG: TlpA disulfide reductase family protein [Chloroflexi bacterium]|nr:TlpA disulfide reductase family protein [Chloroflexota bacterium]
MTSPDETPQTGAPDSGPTASGRRRLLFFLLSMTPVLAIIALLFWGQLRTDGNPGGVLVHEESSESRVAVREAPDFAGFDLVSGLPVNADSLRGRVVMVDFWSSWCAACRIEAADLAQVYTEYEGAPVEFVGIAVWDRATDALDHIEGYGVTYLNILDERGTTAVSYGVRGVPEKFFIDTEGRIVRKLIGPVSAEELRGILNGLLAVS